MFLVPLLPLVTEITLHQTVATSLLTVACVSSWNSFKFSKMELLSVFDQRILALCLGAMMGAASGVLVGEKLSESFLEGLLNVTLGTIGLALLLKRPLEPSVESPPRSRSRRFGLLPLVLSGFAVGAVSGMTGIGGGVILGAVFGFVKWFEHKEIVPALNLYMAAVGCFASFVLWLEHPQVSWPLFGVARVDLGLIFTWSAALFFPFGEKMRKKIDERIRLRVLICALILILFRNFVFQVKF